MPPKKKARGAAAAAASGKASPAIESPAVIASPSPSPAAASPAALAPSAAAADPYALTANGVEALRLLSKHRPQRLAVGGIALAAPDVSAAAAASPPQPVTLQIVQVNRYFVDARFWPLVGVPFPVLPSATPQIPRPQQAAQQQGNGDRMEVDSGNGVASIAAAASPPPLAPAAPVSNAPPGFDAYSDLNVAYDLVLSDGRFQLKALLSPTLSIHLEKGGLLPLGVIRVLEASQRFDETVVHGPGFFLIKQIDILSPQLPNIILSDPSVALSFPSWVNASDALNKPLIGGPRSYYLSLFNDDTVIFDKSNYPQQGEAERVENEERAMAERIELVEESKEGERRGKRRGRAASPAESGLMVAQDSVLQPRMIMKEDTITIAQLLKKGHGFAAGDKVIVCRIFAKSRIFNFGRGSAGSKSDMLRAPFNFELLVGDQSNEQIKVVLWNTLVGAYFERTQIGQTIALRGFRLKPARSDGQYELALNPYNPIGSIRVLEGLGSVEDSVGEFIPPLNIAISPISLVKTMPESSYFDTAGVVTYAGPMLREWSQPKRQFFQYRWLMLVDHSCGDALPVKVFTNSQQRPLEEVRVADVLYLSNLTVVSARPTSESNPASRSFLARSTNYTLLLDAPAMQLMEHPYLVNLIKWSQQANHADFAFYPSTYTWNLDFAHYKSLYTDSITPLREIAAVREGLRFQQKKGVLLQACLVELVVHPAGLRGIEAGVMSESEYDQAIERLYPGQRALAAAAAAAAPLASPAAPEAAAVAAPAKRGRPRKAAAVKSEPAAAAAAAAASPDAMVDVAASQETTTSRRSTRRGATQADAETKQAEASTTGGRKGRSRTRGADDTIAASQETTRSTRSASARGGKQTSRSTSRGESKGKGKRKASAKGKKGKQRAASVGEVEQKGDRVVKTVIRKRKASRSATPAAPAADAAAAAAAAPSLPVPSPAAASASPAASPAPSPAVPQLSSHMHPSAASVLATLILRDLNGESELRVELHDPVLPHVNFERASGSVAEQCETPKEAPRVFLALSHVLPAAAFSQAEWGALLLRCAGAPAAVQQPARGKKKAAPAPERTIQDAIRQLHDGLMEALQDRRLLLTVNFTRLSYKQIENRLTTIFAAER